MRRTPVDSTNLASVGYDPGSVTLELEFRNGHVYRYRGVPSFVHRALMASGSKGAYFTDFIRDRFPFDQIV